MRRTLLFLAAGALMVALAATAALAQSNTATLSLEVITEGEVPQDTIFRAVGGPPNGALSAIELTDSDGDGTYTGSVDLQTGEYRVFIEQGTSGEPGRSTIWGPEIISLNEDTTISTRAVFDSGPGEQNEITGTEESETIYGTYSDDQVIGKGGHDLLVGEAGADWILGGPGHDFLVAGYGYWQVAPDAPASPDFIQGGEGNDLIDAADKAGAPDTVECGPGNDLVYAGVEDYVAADCEFVYRYEGF